MMRGRTCGRFLFYSHVELLACRGCITVSVGCSVRMSPPLLLSLLLMIEGVCVWGEWSVSYSPSHICALKGSTVTIKCTYSYPAGYQITEVFWTNTDISDFPDLSKDFTYSQRIEYLGDKDHNCSVKLTDVRLTDSQIYYFRFITDRPEGKWTGAPGVSLEITDLQVMSDAERVIEGRSVTLTCTSTCSLTDTSTFIWFRNTRTVNDTDNPQLILRSVRRENAGDYSCAVKRHNLTSPPRRLNVIYPPENTRVLVSHSGVIVEGDSVNLICRSESNPPANISWFKENQTSSVGSGQMFSITNITPHHTQWFYCVAQNELGSQRSDIVSLTVKGVSVSYVGFGVGLCVGIFGISLIVIIVIFICRRKSWRRETSNPKPKNDDDQTYTGLDLQTRSSDLYDTLTPNRKMRQDAQL